MFDKSLCLRRRSFENCGCEVIYWLREKMRLKFCGVKMRSLEDDVKSLVNWYVVVSCLLRKIVWWKSFNERMMNCDRGERNLRKSLIMKFLWGIVKLKDFMFEIMNFFLVRRSWRIWESYVMSLSCKVMSWKSWRFWMKNIVLVKMSLF